MTGSGYEVSNREVEGLGATVGTTADAAAVSTGRAVEVLAAETSLSYELSLRYHTRRVRAQEILRMDPEATIFFGSADLHIEKQAIAAGAKGFLLKPFRIEELLSAISEAAADLNAKS